MFTYVLCSGHGTALTALARGQYNNTRNGIAAHGTAKTSHRQPAREIIGTFISPLRKIVSELLIREPGGAPWWSALFQPNLVRELKLRITST